ncbi:MAG: IS3 family transposase [Sarcina sp.]
MCSILGIPRSTYYSKVNSKKSNREIENEGIKESIVRIYNDSKCVYGAPRIHATLIKENINISLKKVQRLMKDLGIRSITIKKYRPTSSKKPKEGLENVLKRDFSTTTVNEKWVGDIT